MPKYLLLHITLKSKSLNNEHDDFDVNREAWGQKHNIAILNNWKKRKSEK